MRSQNENFFRHIRKAVIFSFAGFSAAWNNEKSFRYQTIVIALMLPVGIWIGETAVEWALLLGSAMLVLITELLNSAVETVVDRIGAEQHILSKQAKDLGSAAAAMSMLTAAIVWSLIAYENFLG
jgi:diacylglycerol kinase (ATP)